MYRLVFCSWLWVSLGSLGAAGLLKLSGAVFEYQRPSTDPNWMLVRKVPPRFIGSWVGLDHPPTVRGPGLVCQGTPL